MAAVSPLHCNPALTERCIPCTDCHGVQSHIPGLRVNLLRSVQFVTSKRDIKTSEYEGKVQLDQYSVLQRRVMAKQTKKKANESLV